MLGDDATKKLLDLAEQIISLLPQSVTERYFAIRAQLLAAELPRVDGYTQASSQGENLEEKVFQSINLARGIIGALKETIREQSIQDAEVSLLSSEDTQNFSTYIRKPTDDQQLRSPGDELVSVLRDSLQLSRTTTSLARCCSDCVDRARMQASEADRSIRKERATSSQLRSQLKEMRHHMAEFSREHEIMQSLVASTTSTNERIEDIQRALTEAEENIRTLAEERDQYKERLAEVQVMLDSERDSHQQQVMILQKIANEETIRAREARAALTVEQNRTARLRAALDRVRQTNDERTTANPFQTSSERGGDDSWIASSLLEKAAPPYGPGGFCMR